MAKKKYFSDQTIMDIDAQFMAFIHFCKSEIMLGSIQGLVTLSQFGVLYHLYQQSEITMKELTRLMDQTHGASTGLVDRLIRQNLVQRQRSQEDRRVVHVFLTDQGRALVEQVGQRRKDIYQRLLKNMTESETEIIKQLLEIFKDKSS